MDIELVKKAKNGDHEALTQIYADTESMVYFTALGIVKNEDDAQDMVQDTYIKVFQNLSRLSDEVTFIKWLQTIVANISKNYLKKHKPALFQDDKEEESKISTIEEISENFLPQTYVDNKANRDLIKDMVYSLPDAQRTAVIYYYFDEMSISQVSKLMETTDGTTKSRLNYARKQIKEKVEEQEKNGTKLYAGMPMLAQILHLVSQEYHLPAAAAKAILANSLQSAGISAGAAQATATTATHAVAAGQAGAAGTAATGASGTTAATGFFAKIAALSIGTKVAVCALAAVVLIGGGVGVAAAVKHNQDAAQAAVVALQQKKKSESEAAAQAASETEAKKKEKEDAAKAESEAEAKKAESEAEAKKAETDKKNELKDEFLKKLCYEWLYDGNGNGFQKYVTFCKDGTCSFSSDNKVPEGDQAMADAKVVHEECKGTYQVVGENEVSVNLTYSQDGVADSSKNCSAVLVVGWNWGGSELKDMVLTECQNAIPMLLTLKSGQMPLEQKAKVGSGTGYYRDGESSLADSSGSQPAPQSAACYAKDCLGMTYSQIEAKYGKNHSVPKEAKYSNYEFEYSNIPITFYLDSDPSSSNPSTAKVQCMYVKSGGLIDSKYKGGMTYQQIKEAGGSAVGTPQVNQESSGYFIIIQQPDYNIYYDWDSDDYSGPVDSALVKKD